MILCPECGSEVDEQALTCPLCSYVLAKMARKESRATSQPSPVDYRHYTHYASYQHQKMKSQELLKFFMIFCGFFVLAGIIMRKRGKLKHSFYGKTGYPSFASQVAFGFPRPANVYIKYFIGQ